MREKKKRTKKKGTKEGNGGVVILCPPLAVTRVHTPTPLFYVPATSDETQRGVTPPRNDTFLNMLLRDRFCLGQLKAKAKTKATQGGKGQKKATLSSNMYFSFSGVPEP